MRRFWSPAEIMLLHPNLQVKYSKTTKVLMEAWRSATKVLRFGGPVLFIPAVLDMEQLFTLLSKKLDIVTAACSAQESSPHQGTPRILGLEQLFTLLSKYTEWGALCHPQARSWFRKMGVNCLMQLKSATGNWTPLQQLAALKNLLPTRELLEYLDSFQLFLIRVNTDVPKLEDSPSWYWDATSSKITGWNHTTSTWRLILSSPIPDDSKLHDRWGNIATEITWTRRWKLTWTPGLPTSSNVWLWRLLRRGFFTGKKAQTFRVASGFCPRCPMIIESLEHIYWDCPSIRTRRLKIQELLEEPHSNITPAATLLQTVDGALMMKHCNIAPLLLVITECQATWADRTARIFRNSRSIQPAVSILSSVNETINFMFKDHGERQIPDRLKAAKSSVQEWMKRWQPPNITSTSP
ncbi:hypothetical protein R1sor_015612 [Riccia sorocarpa]|uniref:Reverse transcriptase zinc-binding domain-containing protein n=1 Tax=Riccia sorocarpa TaxID=122646 RepID=A0ABD3HD44_9MARC